MGAVIRDTRSGGVIWAIRYQDVDRRVRKERTNAENKTLARRILAERENAVEKARLMKLSSVMDLIAPKACPMLRAFATTEYLAYVTANCSPTTLARVENALNVNVLPALGARVLSEINAGHLQRYSDARLRAGARPATARQELMILSGIFREAMKRELVDRNPVRLVSKPRVENEIVRYLTADQERRLLSFTAEPLRSAILVAIHSGMRESEELNLTWADVQFGKGAADSFIVVRHTKSKRDRVIPMSETLYRTLQVMPRHMTSPYVFTNSETGTRFQRFNADGWRAGLRRAGIRNFRWHDLRHTFGSRLAQAGESLIAIKDLMGHSAIAVTMRYAHLAPANLRAAIRALDRAPEFLENGAHRSAHPPTVGESAAV